MDTQLIPASLFAFQRDIGFHLSDIAILTTVQMVLTNLAAPFWGILADRGILTRRKILMIGALGEALAVSVIASVTNIIPMVFCRAASGFFLASLRPVCNGLIADMTSENYRGKIFGRVQSALLFGMFCSTMVAGNVANIYILGLPGWRIMFVLAGFVACCVAAAVARLLVEPPRTEAADNAKGCRAVLEELLTVVRFLTIPTFGVMIMQGIFGTIPWSVMGNGLLYFKLCGLKDWEASILTSEGTVMGIFGNLLGGIVADALARRLGYHGRPLSAQITVAIGIPLVFLQFYGIPAGQGTFAVYFAVIAGFGILGSWAQSGTNFPILSDIVPAKDRSKVMAWECALENSIANAIGPIFVSFLAESVFGYEFGEAEMSGKSLESAVALGKAMTFTICIPWLITLLAYTLLHWSYPRDMRRLLAARKKEQVQAWIAIKPGSEDEGFSGAGHSAGVRYYTSTEISEDNQSNMVLKWNATVNGTDVGGWIMVEGVQAETLYLPVSWHGSVVLQRKEADHEGKQLDDGRTSV
eukprot:TRINITY_DN62781_c0_g1_i1.p1 TRINITY_DN62781_c0_g1~~TRINITY_DN62781_c0_g1_i1.p1  ORF type:complete len:609 (-),score=126.05 TRINITY_DN62781_c0_g1_i1:106-1686(-)